MTYETNSLSTCSTRNNTNCKYAWCSIHITCSKVSCEYVWCITGTTRRVAEHFLPFQIKIPSETTEAFWQKLRWTDSWKHSFLTAWPTMFPNVQLFAPSILRHHGNFDTAARKKRTVSNQLCSTNIFQNSTEMLWAHFLSREHTDTVGMSLLTKVLNCFRHAKVHKNTAMFM